MSKGNTTAKRWVAGVDTYIEGGYGFAVATSDGREYVATALRLEDAELIVRAVNAHDDLVNTLRLIINLANREICSDRVGRMAGHAQDALARLRGEDPS